MNDDVAERRTRPWNEIAKTAAMIARDGVPKAEMDIAAILESIDGPVLMFGDSGSFKSWLALFIGAAILNGAPFLGRATRRREYVLYLNFDGGVGALERRVVMMGLDDEHFIVVSPPDGWDAAAFDDLLGRFPGAFVVIDCLADVFQADPNKDVYGAETRAFLKRLRSTYAKHGANGIIIDHARRPDARSRTVKGVPTSTYIGSGQKKAATRMMWSIDRIVADDERPTNEILLRCTKMNEVEHFEPFRISFDFSDGLASISEQRPTVEPAAAPSAVDLAMAEQIEYVRAHGRSTAKVLGADAGGSGTKKDALKRNRAAGRLIPVGGKTKPQFYDLPKRAGDHGDDHGELIPGLATFPEKPSNDKASVVADRLSHDRHDDHAAAASTARTPEGVDVLHGDHGEMANYPVGVSHRHDRHDGNGPAQPLVDAESLESGAPRVAGAVAADAAEKPRSAGVDLQSQRAADVVAGAVEPEVAP